MATRAALLKGARTVFAEHGYERATVAEIVTRSGTSTGSLYNQYGSKPGIFFALHDGFRTSLWDTTASAMDQARAAGVTDPVAVYLRGARAYLLACWEDRDLALLFASGDAPQGQAARSRSEMHRWVHQNATVLQVDSWRLGEPFAAAVTGIVSAAIPQVCKCDQREDAAELTEYFAELITRLTRPTNV